MVFPQEFKELKSSDKPDLIDTSLQMGIEVIHPIDEKHKELDSYYDKNLSGKIIGQVSEDGLSKFRSNSYDVIADSFDGTIYAYRRPYKEFEIELLYNAISKKVKKLNQKQYRYSNNISLYLEMAMCSLQIANLSVAEKILNYTKELQKTVVWSYKEIFYDCLYTLYRINLTTDEITEIDMFPLTDAINQRHIENMKKEGFNF